MTRKLIAGTSWKMNKTASETAHYLQTLLNDADFNRIEVFILPPFTSLSTAASLLHTSAIAFGAQNMHWEDAGAWTGEVSAPMLVEAGCRYVELGHSERRTYFAETDDTVNLKVLAALRHYLTPICIGETRDEHDRGDAAPVLQRQIDTALRGVQSEPPRRNPRL
ncbi:MAG: triose-phosphate isomerase [Anaerolineae bacterium]